MNVREHGIETIEIFELDLDTSKANYLLDGEIFEDGNGLVKRPMILLSVDYLKEIFPALKKSTPMNKKDFEECKVLPKIPRGRIATPRGNYKKCDFVLFDYDVAARDEIIKTAFSEIGKKGRINNWKYRSLCPATWKTLETCIEEGIIGKSKGVAP